MILMLQLLLYKVKVCQIEICCINSKNFSFPLSQRLLTSSVIFWVIDETRLDQFLDSCLLV